MSVQDKVTLLNKIEETLKPRMFANLLEEATDEIQDTLTEFDVKMIINNCSLEKDDYLGIFIAAKTSEGKSEKTIMRYYYLIKRALLAMGVSARYTTTEHLRVYFEQEINRGIALTTVKGVREVLNSFFGWLFKEQLIKYNPVNGIEPINAPDKVKEAYSNVDIEQIKRHCKCVRDSAIINLMICTACRISEITSLNIADIDFNKKEAIVLGKGNKERRVYLSDITIVLLKEYLATRNDDNPALFLSKNHTRLHPSGVRAMLKEIEKATGIENIHPHRFRRTCITNLLNHGMPIQNVAILAGHSKIDTTMKYYYASPEHIKTDFQKYSW